MNRIAAMMSVVLLITGASLCFAQGAKPAEEKRTISQVLDRDVASIEGDLVPAAEAMPEDKYSFTPTNGEFKGVRSFALQVKHIAAVNYMVGSAIVGEKPPVELGGENGPDLIKSKADIIKFLKDSFAYAHKAVGTIDEKNVVGSVKSPFGEGMVTRLGMATVFSWHSMDHYGQIVEYLRMNGIVPPASR